MPSNLDGNQTLQYGFDDEQNAHRIISLSGLVPESFDEVNLTYVTAGNGAGEIETVEYVKNSTTVATLTLSYNGDNKLTSVVRS